MGVAWMNAERFYAKTVEVDGCLIWQGKGRIGEYGVAGYLGKHWLAHRLSYHFKTGDDLGPDDVIRHSCDTPLCVRPEHLSKGTHADNVDDKVQKLRHRFGERHPAARITQQDAEAIRRLVREEGQMQKTVAEAFGLSKQQVSRIVRGERWMKGD